MKCARARCAYRQLCVCVCVCVCVRERERAWSSASGCPRAGYIPRCTQTEVTMALLVVVSQCSPCCCSITREAHAMCSQAEVQESQDAPRVSDPPVAD